MNKFVISLLILISLICNCKPNRWCHNSLEIINNSGSVVYLCFKIDNGSNSNEIFMSLTKALSPGENYRQNFGKSCIEKKYSEKNKYNFYIIDPLKYNNGPYPIDSIYSKNIILKEYNLTANDIKKYNYKITYP